MLVFTFPFRSELNMSYKDEEKSSNELSDFTRTKQCDDLKFDPVIKIKPSSNYFSKVPLKSEEKSDQNN